MAEFCKACFIELFGEDFCELAGITKEVDFEKGLACAVICEGCGIIQVDPEGNCLSKNCLKQGKEGHGLNFKGGD